MYSRFLLLIFCCISSFFFGQKFATSPFSSYGLGEFGSLDNANFIGIGNAHVGMIDSTVLNYYNPSSYSSLAYGQPLFSIGVSYLNSKYTENNQSFSTNLVGINHFSLAVPFAKIFGVAFGLKPFSRVGYSLYENDVIGTDTIRYSYRGSGSINDAFAGFSVKVLNHRTHQLSIGSNLSYLFGSTSNERLSYLTSQSSGGLELLKYQAQSLYYTIGLNYMLKLKNDRQLILGVSYNNAQNLHVTKQLDLYHLQNVYNSNTVSDTISAFYESGTIQFPSMYDVGFTYKFRQKADSSFNKTKIFQLNIYGSYQVQNWSDYKTSFSNDSTTNMLNSSKISFGLEFSPHYDPSDRTKSIKYLSRIKYRAGFQYSTLPLQRSQTQLSNSGITFGLCLPVISQRSVSSVSLGLSVGNRGNNQSTSLNERYVGVNFGITLAPGISDKWFRKYKID